MLMKVQEATVRNGFRGSFFFVAVLLVAFSSLGLASPCTPGSNILGGTGTTLVTGLVLTSTFSCTEGSNTFSNFEVVGNTVPVPVTNWSLSTGPATSPTGLVLDFAYSPLDSNGDDFLLTFDIVPGVSNVRLSAGPSVFVTELLCSVPTGPGGSCPSLSVLNTSPLIASNGSSSSSSVKAAGTDYVFHDVAGGSDFTESFAPVPEPGTLSLMGLVLVAICFPGRKRLYARISSGPSCSAT